MTDSDAIVLKFDVTCHSLDILQRSAYAIADLGSVEISQTDGHFACHLYPLEGQSSERLAHRFRVEVIDQALRARITAETAPLRNLIFAVAFSGTGLVEADHSGTP